MLWQVTCPVIKEVHMAAARAEGLWGGGRFESPVHRFKPLHLIDLIKVEWGAPSGGDENPPITRTLANELRERGMR